MSFRTEEKILLKRSDTTKLKNFIFKNNGKSIYPNRNIKSIYFDNKNFQSFHDSEDGCTPRKKIRIRNYNNESEFFLEKKITSVEGKFKTSNKISNQEQLYYLKNDFFDSTYGSCYPTIEVGYVREYYSIKDIRVTIDYDITYSSVKYCKTIKDTENLILELKSKSINNSDFFLQTIPMNRIRFSKYCMGINVLGEKLDQTRYQLNI